MIKAPPPNAFGRVIRWIMLIIVLYILLHGSFNTQKLMAPIQSIGTPQSLAKKDCDSDNPFKNFSLFATPLLPSLVSEVHTENTAVGTGEPAVCGQNATLRYEYATENKKIVFSNLKTGDASHIRIGGNELLHGVEIGVIGMKPGGERTMLIPASLAFEHVKEIHQLKNNAEFKFQPSSESINAKASLLALSPTPPSSSLPLRIVNQAFHSGPPVNCGDTVTANIVLWKLDGTSLFSTADSKPLTFTLGDSKVPFGIEQGIIGMAEGSERTLIIPPAYMHILRGDAGTALLPTTDEIILAEIKLLPLEKENTTPAPIPTKP
jgi:FKBP-type peptidyl-prolyl cis-trans isomerase